MAHAEPGDPIEAVRTPEDRFANLPDYPFSPNYADVGRGLRMHYVDQGTGHPILCLHGEPSWSYLYRKMIPILAEHHRVIAPDLIGFGKSDKPVDRDDYTYKLHFDSMKTLVTALDLKGITLVCQDWGGLIGLPVATEMPDRFDRLVIMNTGLPTGEQAMSPAFMLWRSVAEKNTDMDIGRVIQTGTATKLLPEVIAAYNAPFPDVRYKAGARKFPLLVPITPEDEAVPAMRLARQKLKAWQKPVLIMFSDRDPITAGGDKLFRAWIPSAIDEPEVTIEKAGHFLQEDKGEEIATRIVDFLKRNPVGGK
jgi:haloalkane dehalogenase